MHPSPGATPDRPPRAASRWQQIGDAASDFAGQLGRNPALLAGVAAGAAGRWARHLATLQGDEMLRQIGDNLAFTGTVVAAPLLAKEVVQTLGAAWLAPPEFARPVDPAAPRPRPPVAQEPARAAAGPVLVSQRISRWAGVQAASGIPAAAWVHATPFAGIAVNAQSSAAFQESLSQVLHALEATRTGRAILQQVRAIHAMYPDKRVVIEPGTDARTYPAWRKPEHVMDRWNFADTAVARSTGGRFMPYVAGVGADTAVIRIDLGRGTEGPTDPERGRAEAPSNVAILGHELIHAVHLLHGATYGTPRGSPLPDRNTAAAEEELRTTGVGPWRDEPLSENALRLELGLPPRESYGGNRGVHLREPPERNSPRTQALLDAASRGESPGSAARTASS